MIRNFQLTQGEVHIWDATLEQSAEQVDALRNLLSEDERSRANAYHFARDRRRFIVARSVLRSLLGHYLNMNPHDVQFIYSEKGKPSIVGTSAIQFNVSHSYERAVYAFGNEHPLGIDLEYIREVMDMQGVAQSNFSAREKAVFNALPKFVQQQAFFNCWTRKEAFIKALGEGLSHPLDSFAVTLAPGEPACLVDVSGDPSEARQWTLREFCPQAGYVGALATRQTVEQVTFHHWDFTD